MEIVSQSPDELVIRCGATFNRVFGGVFPGIGALMLLLFLGGMVEEARKPDGGIVSALGMLVCGGGFSMCFLVPGIWIYRSAKEKDCRFDGLTRRVRITVGTEVEEIEFQQVQGARVDRDSDGDHSLALYFHQHAPLGLTQVVSHNSTLLDHQAEVINQFLKDHS